MTTLLLGANGQLGRSFLHGGLSARDDLIIATRDGEHEGFGHAELADLSKPETLVSLMDRHKPQIIINTAAYTAVDNAEDDEAVAMRVNADAVGIIGEWAARHSALVVHYSTDYVFDGRASTPYSTAAELSPLGAYGRSKAEGERALAASGAAHMILRTSWVYAAHGKNFLRTMLHLASTRDTLNVVADQTGVPTSTDMIVAASLSAIDQWRRADKAERTALQGVHHLVANGQTTWHVFAKAIFDTALADQVITHKPEVLAISTSQFPTRAERPKWSVLDNAGFQTKFGYALPNWESSLREVIAKLKKTRLLHSHHPD